MRLLAVREVQSRPDYTTEKAWKSAIHWQGDIVPKRGADQGTKKKTENPDPSDMSRALFGDDFDRLLWVPATERLLALVGGSTSAWIAALATTGSDNFAPRKRSEMDRIYSALSKGIHHEFVLPPGVLYDRTTVADLVQRVVQAVAEVGLVSHFCARSCVSMERTESTRSVLQGRDPRGNHMKDLSENQSELILAAEDCAPSAFDELHRFSKNDRRVLNTLAAHGPVLLRGGRGSGKSAFMIAASRQLDPHSPSAAAIGVYMSLRNAPLLKSVGDAYGRILCEILVRQVRDLLGDRAKDFEPEPEIVSVQAALSKLAANLGKRIVLFFDDAAHLGREASLEEFFDIYRTLGIAPAQLTVSHNLREPRKLRLSGVFAFRADRSGR